MFCAITTQNIYSDPLPGLLIVKQHSGILNLYEPLVSTSEISWFSAGNPVRSPSPFASDAFG
jgi:hypothetical protein